MAITSVKTAPSRQTLDAVSKACRLIENATDLPSLDDLAAHAGLSAFHFNRQFKSITGLTPKAYASAHRAALLRQNLQADAGSITQAIYDAGFNASSRFYEQSDKVLGMTPAAYRKGGKGTNIRFAIGQTTLGAILVAATEKGICAILMDESAEVLIGDLQDRFPNANLIGADSDFEQWVAKVVGFVERPALGLDLPLDIQGTAFQQRVWQALMKIPAGQTATYADVAHMMGAPKAVRAVAGACAANKIAVAIPCHRVIRTDGGLSGYRWGVERKRVLLDREAKSAKGV